MATVYSVSQINLYIKNMFSNDYLLRNVQIKGEISNVKYHSSGHIYFTLKEEGSSISGVMFKSARYQGLDFTLENGQSVVATGNVTVYERDGRYQIYAREIRLDGLGSLYEEYERLKQKLYEEGLFEFEHKKPIPAYPKKIGIVTAETGAAIQDILTIAKRRNPFVQLYLYPALVQGEGAAKTIAAGIEKLDTMGMDTIIIGRGGGSIEDLWPFNEEIVARAIYRANTPIISGTGHEIDNTIADYAADLRAPTPSAACELAIPDVMSALHQVKQQEYRLKRWMEHCLLRKKQTLQTLEARLSGVSVENRYRNQRIYLDSLQDRLSQSMQAKYQKRRNYLEILLAKLDGLSPTGKLAGGYGYIERADGEAVKSVKDIQEKDAFTVTLRDGRIEGIVTAVSEIEE
ncbi:MAG: exodeoxyribonuclease VII large subunit [Bacteroidales bacterium]|nr:exodeoxyribonuclease VII large subunit [Clostridium sp.]MCM1202639.1 exodeoxyribonuclease VII large subunit [Bacteroidales bacterium]